MLPFSLGSSVFSAIGGVLVAVTKDYQIIMWASWAIYTLGWGLCIMLDSYSTMYVLAYFLDLDFISS